MADHAESKAAGNSAVAATRVAGHSESLPKVMPISKQTVSKDKKP